MNIHRLTIRNFRNIEEEKSFQLNQRFTVIIGINGKGKSTMLHAVRVVAGTYLLGIPEALKRHIWESEIRVKNFGTHHALQTPTIVKAEGSIDGKLLSKPWQRQIPEGKTKTTSNYEDVGEIRNIAKQKYDLITKNGEANIDNPVIAYFGTGRLYGSSRNTLGSFVGRQVFKYGYYSWAEMQYATYQYSYWLNSHRFLVSDGMENHETYLAFFEAIKAANPYITALDFDGKELRLKVKLGDDDSESQFLPLSLHSDGIITHTAMVAELAFRCIVLNAHHKENAVKRSRGVVMIDEIDLHLHPNWQRHVIDDLKKAFPCIQFVATTHSPFIVQSLDASELINLDIDTDVSPKDLSIEEVSQNIMGIESEMSEENQSDENLSTSYLERLGELQEQNKNDIIKELNEIELKISDPAVRAFLKMKRLGENI
jgi:predicted ATP-binding protein involved in virulence